MNRKDLRPWNLVSCGDDHVWELVSYPWLEGDAWFINARYTPDDPTSMKTIQVDSITEVCVVP